MEHIVRLAIIGPNLGDAPGEGKQDTRILFTHTGPEEQSARVIEGMLRACEAEGITDCTVIELEENGDPEELWKDLHEDIGKVGLDVRKRGEQFEVVGLTCRRTGEECPVHAGTARVLLAPAQVLNPRETLRGNGLTIAEIAQQGRGQK